MRNSKWISVIVIEICAFTMPVLSSTGGRQKAEPNLPTIAELLDKYTQALDPIQSFIGSSEFTNIRTSFIPSWRTNVKNAISHGRCEYRTDGKGRTSFRFYKWGKVSANQPEISESAPSYSRRVIGDDFTYNHNRLLRTTTSKGSLIYLTKGTKDFEETREGGSYITKHGIPSHFLGYISTKARLDGILKNAKRISVRQEPEIINGSPCYVVEADTKHGEFTVWLDSEHGYHPARMKASVGIGDDIGEPGSPAIITKEQGITREYFLDNVRFEKIDGIWMPMEADSKLRIVLGYENGFSENEKHFKYTNIMLNPDHDALNSFGDPLKNPELDPELSNGTRVHLGDGIRRTWLDGKIVDSEGHEVDLKTLKPPSLVDKPLPDLRQFNLRLDPKWTESKMVLICFWDMDQRPSRNCILTLNGKAQALLDRNVYMVLVQAEQVDEKKLIAWLKKNRIDPPVGISRSNLPRLKQSWGVQSLPWLILTDKKHIVTAEGFNLDELDEKISILRSTTMKDEKEVENAKQ